MKENEGVRIEADEEVPRKRCLHDLFSEDENLIRLTPVSRSFRVQRHVLFGTALHGADGTHDDGAGFVYSM